MIATATNERPIPLHGWEVKAMLDGRKTQTRRIVKWDREANPGYWPYMVDGSPALIVDGSKAHNRPLRCPYGQPGDRLVVKEALRGVIDTTIDPAETMPIAAYAADMTHLWTPDKFRVPWRWKRPTLPSMFMPRELSRITLEIAGVRVERVGDIGEADAEAEGVAASANFSARDHFCRLWNEINAARGFGWTVNLWVWAITFRRIEGEQSHSERENHGQS